MRKIAVIYSNDRSPIIKPSEFKDFQSNGFEVVELTAQEFIQNTPEVDIVWPYFRSIPQLDQDVLAYIETKQAFRKVVVINDYRKFGNVDPSNKWSSYNLVEKELGIHVPRTYKVNSVLAIPRILSKLSFLFVLKAYPSGQGKDVHICKNIWDVYSLYFSKRFARKHVLLQELAKTSVGTDLRVMFVGGEIIFAIKRTSKTDFRANIALGATYEVYPLSPKQKEQVSKIAGLKQLDIVGVDFLFGEGEELIFNEFNSAPAIFEFSDPVAQALDKVCRSKESRTI